MDRALPWGLYHQLTQLGQRLKAWGLFQPMSSLNKHPLEPDTQPSCTLPWMRGAHVWQDLPWLSVEAAIWYDRHKIEQRKDWAKADLDLHCAQARRSPLWAESTSSWTGRDRPWTGIRTGRYQGSQELRDCLLYSRSHRFSGLSKD